MRQLLFIALVCVLAGGSVSAVELDRYGGWAGLKGERTGFFHTEKLADRWWLVTPEGNAFFSAGVYCVRMNGIPDVRTGRRTYRENCLLVHGNETEWVRSALKRLDDWRFNTIGDWSSASVIVRRRFAYVLSASLKTLGRNVLPVAWASFPDVFDPAFEEQSREVARKVVKTFEGQVNDPYLLGYFLCDEAGFYGSENAWGSLVEDYARLPAEWPGKVGFVNFVREKYGTIEALNEAWGADYRDFDEVLKSRRISGRICDGDKSEFLRELSARFVRPAAEEIRRMDPNHLILGPRPSRFYKEIMEGIGPYCDVIAVSAYHLNRGYSIDPEFDSVVSGIVRESGRPVMLGFLVGARSPDYPNGVMNWQYDRGVSYARYLEKVCSHPAVVGLHWFQYFDPPAANKQDTGNWGLVTEGDTPYADCVEVVAAANARLYRYLVPDALAGALPEFAFRGGEAAAGISGTPFAVANGDFEGRRESPWLFQKWQGQGRARLTGENPHGGRQCLELEGSGAGWASNVVAVQYGPKMSFASDRRYRLCGWFRTEGLESWCGVRMKVRRTDGTAGYVEAALKRDVREWTQVYVEFDNATEKIEGVEYLAVMLVGAGRAWADDVTLQDLGVAPAEAKPAEWPVGLALRNPSAEELDGRGVPVGWTFQTWQGDGRAEVDRTRAHTGERSIMLRGGSQMGWGSTVAAIQSRPEVALEANREYVLAAWVITQSVETGLHVRIKLNYPDGKDEYIQGVVSADLPAWTLVEKRFVLPRPGRIEYVGAVLVGRGLAWIDDLSVEEAPPK